MSVLCWRAAELCISCFPPPSVAGNCTDGDVRLVGGAVPGEGRVEICYGHLWGTVCDDLWGRNEATVVCRQLGYSDVDDSIPFSRAFFGSGLTAIHLDDINCQGNESRLGQCLHKGVGVHNCFNSEDAGVICVGKSDLSPSSPPPFPSPSPLPPFVPAQL